MKKYPCGGEPIFVGRREKSRKKPAPPGLPGSPPANAVNGQQPDTPALRKESVSTVPKRSRDFKEVQTINSLLDKTSRCNGAFACRTTVAVDYGMVGMHSRACAFLTANLYAVRLRSAANDVTKRSSRDHPISLAT
jgi:hypothetical protein